MQSDENLIRYVELETLRESQVVLFASLAEVLLSMPHPEREHFLRQLEEQIAGQLESEGKAYSALSGYLQVMFQELVRTLSAPSDDPDGDSLP